MPGWRVWPYAPEGLYRWVRSRRRSRDYLQAELLRHHAAALRRDCLLAHRPDPSLHLVPIVLLPSIMMGDDG